MAKVYSVQEGDCVNSIAFERGLYWEAVWNHGNNAQLKQLRKNPNILKPGDTLHVPDLTLEEQSRATNKRHKFKLKGVPVKLRLRIMEVPKGSPTQNSNTQENSQTDGQTTSGQAQPAAASQQEEPRSDLPYTLLIDGNLSHGKTSSEGLIELEIVPNAREGKLILDPGTPGEFTVDLKIGCLQPVDEIAGAQARLNNLGFRCGAVDGILGPRTKAALQDFQDSNGLKKSGELDEATKSKLREAHDAD